MSYTMEDFKRDYFREQLEKLTPKQRRELLQSFSAEERLAGLPAEERLASLPKEKIQQYLDRMAAARPAKPRKKRPKE